jgi:hypothetical protein
MDSLSPLKSVKGALATVVCEGLTRQLAFDTLAKYNVLQIGTTGSTHVPPSLTLPILRSLDANTPGLQSINHLLQQVRRPSTKKIYNSKVDKFQDFCGRVQDEAGTPRLSSMPASQTTILAFIGYLASLGRIRS